MDLEKLSNYFSISDLMSFSGVAAVIIISCAGILPLVIRFPTLRLLPILINYLNRAGQLYLVSTLSAFLYACSVFTSCYVIRFAYGLWFIATLILLLCSLLLIDLYFREIVWARRH